MTLKVYTLTFADPVSNFIVLLPWCEYFFMQNDDVCMCICLFVRLISPAPEDLTAPVSAALPVLLRAGRWHPPGDGAGATLGAAAGCALP